MQFFQPLFGFDQAGEVSPGTKIALAIGVFDGVHSGHREIIRTVCRMAEARSAVACALTFEPHPKSIVGAPPELLTSPEERRRLLLDAGADITGTIVFDRQTASIEPEDFLLKLINDPRFELAGISVGEHWRFGNRGKGGGKLIADFAKQYGFEFSAVPELEEDGVVISSSVIRKMISDGNISGAARMLGRYPSLEGRVEKASESQAKSLRPRPQILFLNTESWFLTEFTPASWCSTEKNILPRSISESLRPTTSTGGASRYICSTGRATFTEKISPSSLSDS